MSKKFFKILGLFVFIPVYLYGFEIAEIDQEDNSLFLRIERNYINRKDNIDKLIFESQKPLNFIDRETIKNKIAGTAPDSIKEETGIFIQKTTSGHGAPIIRGMIGRYNLILIDGVRLNNSTYRSGPIQYFNTIDSFIIDTIEITRGPGSVLYGSDALGGVILINTNKHRNFSQRYSLNKKVVTKLSSADSSIIGNIELNGNINNIGYVFGGSYKKFGDIDPGGSLDKETPTGYDEGDYNFNINYRFSSDQEIILNYQHNIQYSVPRYDKYLGSREFIPQNYIKFLYEPQKRDLFYLTYEQDKAISFIDFIKCNISFQSQAETRKEQKSGSLTMSIYDDRTDTVGFNIEMNSKIYDIHTLSYGAEYYNDNVSSSKIERNLSTGLSIDKSADSTFPDGSEYRTLGIFLQDEINLTDKFLLKGGTRYSKFEIDSILRNKPLSGKLSDTFDDLTGSIGLGYKFNDNYHIIFNISQGFRAPNLDDTVTLQTTNQGVDVPSYDLKPEKNIQYEIGIKKQGRLSGSIFYYLSDITDLIERKLGIYEGLGYIDENGNGVKDSSEPLVWQKFNIGKARIIGTEIEAKYQILEELITSLNISWQYGDNLTDKEPLTRIPPIFGTAKIRWSNDSCKRWVEFYTSFAGTQNRLSSRDRLDPRIQPGGTPGWMTMNLKTGVQIFEQMSISFGIENIADVAYRYFGSGIDAPGRNFILSLESRF